MTTAHAPAPGTPAPDGWREGQDGRHPTYRERLTAPWGAWVFGLAMTGSLGIAYGYAVGAPWGAVAFLLAQAAVSWGLLATAPRLRVDERVLRAGRARLPRGHVGRVRVVDAATMRRLRGVDTDAAAYLCVRSWVRRGVVVEVRDPADPHPYWLVSSRRPEALRDALCGEVVEPRSDRG